MSLAPFGPHALMSILNYLHRNRRIELFRLLRGRKDDHVFFLKIKKDDNV